MTKLLNFLVLLTIPFLLIACTDEENPAEFMYEHLEGAVQIEKGVEDIQGPLTEAETNEYEWYEEMLSLSDLEEIEALSQEAIDSAEERRTLIDEEKQIIDEAYEEFQLSITYIEDMEEGPAKDQAEDMVEKMTQRYETYQELYSHYTDTIEMDINLYSLVYQEDLTIEDLQEQHDLVNESYQRINELNEQFNEDTSSFNESKRTFYEVAELDVVFEEL